MTNIECSANCVYQKDGKCSFNRVNANILTPSANCLYFSSAHKNTNN